MLRKNLKNSYILTLVLVLCSTFCGCNPEDEHLEDENRTPASSIQAGILTNMIVSSLDETIFNTSYYLDFDLDQSPDFLMTSKYGPSSPEGYSCICTIEVLGEGFEFMIVDTTTNIFMKVTSDTTTRTDKQVEINISTSLDCTALDSTYMPGHISGRSYIDYVYPEDTISNSRNWNSDQVRIYDNASCRTDEYSQEGDTIYRSWICVNNNCFYVPSGKDCYLGLRNVKDNVSRLGWVKIRLDECTLFVYESAIQDHTP
jgi:hypothetical protein